MERTPVVNTDKICTHLEKFAFKKYVADMCKANRDYYSCSGNPDCYFNGGKPEECPTFSDCN